MTTNEIENHRAGDEDLRGLRARGRRVHPRPARDDARFVSNLDPIVPWAGEFLGQGQRGPVLPGHRRLSGRDGPPGEPPWSPKTKPVVATGDVSFSVRETGKIGSSSWVYIFKLANGQVQS